MSHGHTHWTSAVGSQIASVLPVAAWHALAGRPVVLPYYHMVSDESVPHLRHLYHYKNTAQFKADLDFLLAHFRPVSLEDFLAHVHQGRTFSRRSFLLSFDDGFREMAEVAAPILKAKGVPAVFFVNSAFVDNRELCFHHKISLLLDRLLSNPDKSLLEKMAGPLNEATNDVFRLAHRLRKIPYARRKTLDELAATCGLAFNRFLTEQRPYLSSEQIRSLLRDGFGIGAHSVDHPFYGDLPLEEQLRQTRDSLRFLDEQFGVKQKAFAFPHSDAGVSRLFFDKLAAEGPAVTFGTAGLLPDDRPAHFQRFSLEKGGGAARQIYAWQSARRWYHGLGGNRKSTPGPAFNRTSSSSATLAVND